VRGGAYCGGLPHSLFTADCTLCSVETCVSIVYRLTRIADFTGPVDCPLKRRGDGVSVGDDGDVGGLVVDLGASAH